MEPLAWAPLLSPVASFSLSLSLSLSPPPPAGCYFGLSRNPPFLNMCSNFLKTKAQMFGVSLTELESDPSLGGFGVGFN
jgi:hypothetical protein